MNAAEFATCFYQVVQSDSGGDRRGSFNTVEAAKVYNELVCGLQTVAVYRRGMLIEHARNAIRRSNLDLMNYFDQRLAGCVAEVVTSDMVYKVEGVRPVNDFELDLENGVDLCTKHGYIQVKTGIGFKRLIILVGAGQIYTHINWLLTQTSASDTSYNFAKSMYDFVDFAEKDSMIPMVVKIPRHFLDLERGQIDPMYKDQFIQTYTSKVS